MLTPLVWLYQGPLGIAYVAAAALVFPLLRRFGLWRPNELDFQRADMQGKVVIVTGCNTGIGFPTALKIAQMGATVVMACRSPQRAAEARARMEAELRASDPAAFPHAQAGKLVPLTLDLSSFASVKQFAAAYKSKFRRLDALVCNAGLANTPGQSAEGYDMHMATNYLGHFYLCKVLLGVLKGTEGGARVVSVSSLMHEFGCLDFEGSLAGRYRGWKDRIFGSSYNDSKLAMVLLTLALNDRLKGTNVQAVAVSPGAVASDIWRSFPSWYRALVLDPAMALLFLDNDQGSTPSVFAATHPLEAAAEEDDNGASSSPYALAPYYQPYWTPGPDFLFPFEACGPFQGWRRVRPRLPPDALRVAKELWFTSERCLQQHGHA